MLQGKMLKEHLSFLAYGNKITYYFLLDDFFSVCSV